MISTGTARKNSTKTATWPTDPRVRRKTPDSECDAQDERKHDRQRGGLQRALDTGDDVVLPDIRRDEGLPLRPRQLVFRPEFDADEDKHRSDDQHGDRGREMVANPRARAGCVEEDGRTAHLGDRHSLAHPSEQSPIGSVRMTNPSANRLPIRSTADEFSTHLRHQQRRLGHADHRRDRRVLGQRDEHRTHRNDRRPKSLRKQDQPQVLAELRPSDRAASACPNGIVFTPERTVSQTNAAV